MSEGFWNVSVLSPGDRSALKRCAGQTMDRADAAALMAFHRAWSGTERRSEYAFAALCMQMLWREADDPTIRPMEQILCDMIQVGTKDENRGLLSRVRGTLDTAWANDGFLLGKLCNLARIIRAAQPTLRPDFGRLAKDMRGWNGEQRRVQRRWVGAIFAGVRAEAPGDED